MSWEEFRKRVAWFEQGMSPLVESPKDRKDIVLKYAKFLPRLEIGNNGINIKFTYDSRVHASLTGYTDLKNLKSMFGSAAIVNKVTTSHEGHEYLHCWNGRRIDEISQEKLWNAHASKASVTQVNRAAICDILRYRDNGFNYLFSVYEKNEKYQGKISVKGTGRGIHINGRYTADKAESLEWMVK